MTSPISKPAGFSLVEVVIALGIFSFCVVAIAGLLSVALNSTRSVVNEGAAANIAESIYGGWQAQTNRSASLTVQNLFSNLPSISSDSSRTFYFNDMGQQLSDDRGAAFQVLYESRAAGNGARALNLTFSWPVNAASNAVQTRTYSRVF